MGETVISSTLTYRVQIERGIDNATNHELYQVLAFSFLLMFMVALLYFHVNPNEEDHAIRRSRLVGWLWLVCTNILGLTLLTVGVCIKWAVQAVAHHTTISPFGQSMLTRAVGSSLVLMVGLRLCHYGGRMPRPSHPNHVKIIMWIWWSSIAVASILPFFFGRLFPNHYNSGSPIPPLAISSLWITVVCLLDSSFSHFLDAKHLILNHEGEGEESIVANEASIEVNHPSTEQTALLSSIP